MSGPPPGRYSVWIDVPGFVPALLTDVALGLRDTELGTIRLDAGSRLRLRLLARSGKAPPSYSVWARRVHEPAYQRGASSDGAAEIVVSGLGAGTFEIWGNPTDGSSVGGFRETVEVDGVTAVERTIDLR
jgi:hypothetical protein